MKDFDLAAAKRGARVCTRDGKPARILCFDSNMASDEYATPIVAEVAINGRMNIICYTAKGCLDVEGQSKYDLMMADDDYLEKLERGEPDHIGEPTEKVDDPISLGNEWLNDMIKARSSIFKDLERSLDIERRKYELSKLKHEADMLKLERITENWDYWRCMYAGMAVQGTLARFRLYPDCTCTDNSVYDMAAAESVKYADSLIEELKKTK